MFLILLLVLLVSSVSTIITKDSVFLVFAVAAEAVTEASASASSSTPPPPLVDVNNGNCIPEKSDDVEKEIGEQNPTAEQECAVDGDDDGDGANADDDSNNEKSIHMTVHREMIDDIDVFYAVPALN